MVGSGFYAGIFCMCLATERFLQGRTADVIHTDGEKLDPGESTNEFCVEMRHHVPHQFTLKLQTAPLTQNRIIMRQVIKKIFFLVSRKRSGNKTNKKRLWNLIFYRPTILSCILCSLGFSGLIKSRFL